MEMIRPSIVLAFHSIDKPLDRGNSRLSLRFILSKRLGKFACIGEDLKIVILNQVQCFFVI